MNEVQIFESAQFGQVRTIGDAEKPMFCLADLCRVLEIQPGRAKQRLNQRGITLSNTPTKNQHGATVEQSMVYIDEQNLYKLIMRSDKPQAEAFQDWVCGEVLPSIRKQGGYIDPKTNEQMLLLSKALLIAKDQMDAQLKTIEEQANTINTKTQVLEETRMIIREQANQLQAKDESIRQLTPLVDYTREVLQSTSTFTLTEIAKDLGFRSVYAFTKWAHENGVLYRQSERWMPTAKVSGKGYFTTRTAKYVKSDNTIGTSISTVVTEQGRAYLHNVIAKKGGVAV